ncbi:MAG: AAA family ATPase [Nitrospinaceae bacterium]
MYEKFYQFKEKPFSLTPDPKFLYLSDQHQGALDHMLYGIQQKEGFMVVMGDVGTGKTTICRCLLDRMDNNIEVALILNPMLSDMDLLRTCVQDLGVNPAQVAAQHPVMAGGPQAGTQPARGIRTAGDRLPVSDWFNRASKKDLIDALNAFLLAQHAAGKSTVLIIDEAQNLSLDVMEQLRILSNLETEKDKLLQIIFVGQLELNEKLKLPKLKQLNQRISIRYEITPLSREETKNYIYHRMLVAGASSRVMFARSALREVYDYAGGYPRLINLVCDRALLAGYNDQIDTIGKTQAKLAIRSLLGEEGKKYFLKRFLSARLPLVASVLFFAAGLLFFFLSMNGFSRGTGALKIASAENSGPAVSSEDVFRNKISGKTSAFGKDTESVRSNAGDRIPVTPVSVRAGLSQSNPADSLDTVATGPGEGDREYRIQVYSLKSRTEAEQEAHLLESEGFDVFRKKAVTGGQDWYIVYVGPFKDADSAKIHLDALKFSGRVPILLSVSKTG